MARKISALMLDLSGTVHVDDCLLPGVKEALSLLSGHAVPVQFVSNNSKESQHSLVTKLEMAGLQVGAESVFTSLSAAHALGKTCTQPASHYSFSLQSSGTA